MTKGKGFFVAVGCAAVASAMIASNTSAAPIRDNRYWFPSQLDLSPLRTPSEKSNPLGKSFNYAKAFNQLDLKAVKQDLVKVMTESQSWWPADFGHYGPFFIRMTWHSAGTYRIYDGRGGANGGMQRFAPLNSWPDNANLDKARRLLWPIKQKYGNKISWADLMVLAGNVAMESMGFKTLGYAGGREDAWQPEIVDWGAEGKWLASERHTGNRKLNKPLAATRMGLIYVNPEGPNGVPDPMAAAKDIRATFARMAMNDEETVALIAGGHSFGKVHGAASGSHLGAPPASAPVEQQGLGWKSSYKTGKGPDTITSGLEGAWTVSPAQWTHNYLQNLFAFKWVKTKSPGGATQWTPDSKSAVHLVPDAFDKNKRHAPIMLTTDLSLKYDPSYRKIAKHFLDNPKAFELAFAKAWFKLIHRDMGPRSRYLGSMVPAEVMIWQDPVPTVDTPLVNDKEVQSLKAQVKQSKLSVTQLIKAAWASASTFRKTDMRGGGNGARIRLLPQKDWQVNDPTELSQTLAELKKIQQSFNEGHKAQISLADMIILAGDASVEKAAKLAGQNITVPFIPGRTDALQEMTDVASFEVLKPLADPFRNYYQSNSPAKPEEMMVEKAYMLSLTIPEMTVLIGGMRSMAANQGNSQLGVFTKHPGQLNNEYFVNLLDMSTKWAPLKGKKGMYQGTDRKTEKPKWQASQVDLIFGANAELRAVAEIYAQDNAQQKFIEDFVKAWVKVMQLDRFDLHA